MKEIKLRLPVDRPHGEACEVFDEDIQRWIPGVVGPEVHSWRAETREGPVHVDVVIETGPVFVHSDGSHWRPFTVWPDPTSLRNLVAAILTPRLEGHVGLAPDHEGGSVLVFEGRTTRRSRLTGPLERLLFGDPLAWSGIETLLEHVRQQLEER